MKTYRAISLLVLIFTCCPLLGCGGSGEAEVIQPTENYQPTPQEQQNEERAEAARAEAHN